MDVYSPIVIAILWVALPYEITTPRRFAGASVIALLPGVNRLCRAKLPETWSNFGVLSCRLGVALALAWVNPVVWHAVLVLLAVIVVGSLPVEPQNRIFALLALGAGGLGLTAIVCGISNWHLALAMTVIASVSTSVWQKEWRDEHSEVERRHDDMLDRARIFSWEVDIATGEIVSMVGNIEALLGYRAEELVGRQMSTIVDRSPRPESASSAGPDRSEKHAVVRARHRNGAEVTLREVRLDSKSRELARGVSIDITELAAASEKLRYQAEHDSLTGLSNRGVVERLLTRGLDEDDEPIALVLADLDRFKEVNDTLGHPTGDRVLRALASRFASSLADLDLVARIGGDEFAFVIKGDIGEQTAIEIAERIHRLATAPVEVDGLQLGVACSIGIALAPLHGETYAELFKHADIATYQAKRSGGGVRVFESEPDELSVRRLRLVSELAGAIERNEIELHMQPQVDLVTGKIVGVEGLARWRHPEFGLLHPAAFLHTIEVAADYHRFTDEVLRQATAFAADARASGHDMNVAVNLGTMSFLNKNLPGRLVELLDQHGLPGTAMTLEVTESDLLDEKGADAPVFDQLKALGARLSIDDFGTGYSTFTRLRALDVDEVKIDRAFVTGLGEFAEDTIIVRAIVGLCQLLGHSVVAEGVETAEQMRLLQEFGCTIAQGYYFARPMPQHDLLGMLRERTVFDTAPSGAPDSALEARRYTLVQQVSPQTSSR